MHNTVEWGEIGQRSDLGQTLSENFWKLKQITLEKLQFS